MPIYASFDHYIDHPSHLTPGKRYEVVRDNYDPTRSTHGNFAIVDDEGVELWCLWRGCAHIRGNNWTRHEEPDANPTPEQTRTFAPTQADFTWPANGATEPAPKRLDEFVLRRTPNGGWVVDDGLEDFATGATILGAFTNTDDLIAGLPRLLGGGL
jgi:hypothetical protein